MASRRPEAAEKLVAQSLLKRRKDAPASDRVAAAIRARDGNGDVRTIFETWKPRDRLGLVAERQFRLSTGEAIEQLAENVFVLLTTNETLVRVVEPSSDAERSHPELARAV